MASTLVESIMALLLFSISTSMGMMVYFNIITSTRSSLKVEAQTKVNQVMRETKQKGLWIDDEEDMTTYKIKKTITKYSKAADVYLLDVEAKDKKDKTLFKEQELIYIN